MNWFLLGVCISFLFLTSCGSPNSPTSPPIDPGVRNPEYSPQTDPSPGTILPTTACTVTQTTLGALIQCPDGSSAVVLHGRDGVVTVTESCECPHSGAKKGHRCKE